MHAGKLCRALDAPRCNGAARQRRTARVRVCADRDAAFRENLPPVTAPKAGSSRAAEERYFRAFVDPAGRCRIRNYRVRDATIRSRAHWIQLFPSATRDRYEKLSGRRSLSFEPKGCNGTRRCVVPRPIVFQSGKFEI